MFNIRHPQKTWFGVGSVSKVVEEVNFLNGKHLLFFTDKGISEAGIANIILEQLNKESVEITIHNTCPPEPAIQDLENIFDEYKNKNFDLIIGVGGGSTMDIAKSISVLLTNTGNPRDFLGIDLVPKPGLPTILLPTTSGTGAEATPNAIFSIPEDQVKLAIVSTHLIPEVAIVDPELTITAPPKVTSAAGVDALTHCLETYVAKNATILSEVYSIEGMKLISRSLRKVCEDGSDIKARSDMALGSYYGGVALAGAGAGAIHALAYPLGSRFHIPHGISNSLMFSHVIKVNYSSEIKKFAKIANILDENTLSFDEEKAAESTVGAVKKLCEDCAVPTRLSEVDIPAHAIPELAESAFKLERLLNCNPKQLTLEDIEKIYQSAT